MGSPLVFDVDKCTYSKVENNSCIIYETPEKKMVESETERREREKGKKKDFSLLSKLYGNRTIGFCWSKRQNGPRIESYVWVPKSWSFVKLHEVENFTTWVISSLKVI